MKITRKQLKKLIESFLHEKTSTKTMKCPKCGTINEPGIDKCSNCGHDYDEKFEGRKWKRIGKIRKGLNKIKNKTSEFLCPEPAKSVELNTRNRDRAIREDFIKYGPLNIEEPGDYWKEIAEKWNTTEKAAKKSLCGNCVAFDISPQMEQCMPGDIEEDADGGRLGYCWMHHFKCHSLRTCNTWAKGGPIQTDEVSNTWFEKNSEAALKKDPIE